MCCCILMFIEFFHEMAAKKCDKKQKDGEIEKLLGLYEEKSCLQDIFDKSNQKRDVKEKASDAIAKEFDVQIADVKAKWNAIRGQFERELDRVKSSKSGQSTDDLYVSQWMFWDKLQFLQSVMKTTKRRDALSINDDSFQKNATLSSDEEITDTSRDNTPSKETKPSRVKKRKLEEMKNELLTSCINVLKELQVAPTAEPKEETDHFVFDIAGKLKFMSRQQRILAEKRINDVIFEIEMGEFQQPSSTRNSFNNVAEIASAFQRPCMPALTNNNLSFNPSYFKKDKITLNYHHKRFYNSLDQDT